MSTILSGLFLPRLSSGYRIDDSIFLLYSTAFSAPAPSLKYVGHWFDFVILYNFKFSFYIRCGCFSLIYSLFGFSGQFIELAIWYWVLHFVVDCRAICRCFEFRLF